MNEIEFMEATGYAPELDDLERANCPNAGTLEHWGCGICSHGKPVFACKPCFFLPPDKRQ